MSGKTIDDGGPAFPNHAHVVRDGKMACQPAQGMTLREYFAGQAMAGLCADPQNKGSIKVNAMAAVGMADALIAALKVET